MDYKERLLKSTRKALDELDKVVKLAIEDLEPEKAKIAVQGKIEAVEGSMKLIGVIKDLENKDDKTEEDAKDERKGAEKATTFTGPESKF